MPKKYLISMTDDTMTDKLYYAARDTALGKITWTDDTKKATFFTSQAGAENVLRILEDMCRTARAFNVSMEVEAIEPKYTPPAEKADEIPEKAALEKPPDPVKEFVPSTEGQGSPRSTFSFGKVDPLRLFIRKNEAGQQVYSFMDEVGQVRAVGVGTAEGKDVVKAYCVYACNLMLKKINEAEEKTK